MSKKIYGTIEVLGKDPSQLTALLKFAENIPDLELIEATGIVNGKVIKYTQCKEDEE